MHGQNVLRFLRSSHLARVLACLARGVFRVDAFPCGLLMATVELTLEQLRDALIQLPEPQCRRLLEEINHLASAEEVRAAAQRVGGTFRMPASQRKRMSELLAKGDDGTLTAEESQELDALVDQFERKTLDMTRELTRAVPSIST
jgi:hypothetical protein